MGFGNFKPTWSSGGSGSTSSGGSTGGSGFEDAPNDGKRYVRRNGQWEEVPYATDEQTKSLNSEDSVVTPKSLGGLLDEMGVVRDESSGDWTNDQGELP